MAQCCKIPKTRDLPLLANKMLQRLRRGRRYEPTILRRDSGLYRTSKATRRVSKSPGNLEPPPCGGLSVSFERNGSRRRTRAIASEIRSSLHNIAPPHTPLFTLPFRVNFTPPTTLKHFNHLHPP